MLISHQIPLGQNIHVTTDATVNDGTYIAFIVLMFLGAILGLFLCSAKSIHRPDGSKVILMKNPSWSSEFVNIYETLRNDPYIVLLFPMFWASNWYTTYQQNGVNASHFSTRTRALNSLLFWLAQIIGGSIFGYALDIDYFRRTVRAKVSFAVLFALTFAIWGGGYAFQRQFTRESVARTDFNPTDWEDGYYVGPMFLYIFYGFYDSVWQCCIYWYALLFPFFRSQANHHRYMGALSNSGRKSANLVGFYKSFQSAGAAVIFSLDYNKLSFMKELASTWGLLAGSLVVAAPVIFSRIKDHVDIEEDLKGTDETLADVLPPGNTETTTVGEGDLELEAAGGREEVSHK